MVSRMSRGFFIKTTTRLVASTTTRWIGHEGEVLRDVFLHSLALAMLMSLTVLTQVRLYYMRLY